MHGSCQTDRQVPPLKSLFANRVSSFFLLALFLSPPFETVNLIDFCWPNFTSLSLSTSPTHTIHYACCSSPSPTPAWLTTLPFVSNSSSHSIFRPSFFVFFIFFFFFTTSVSHFQLCSSPPSSLETSPTTSGGRPITTATRKKEKKKKRLFFFLKMWKMKKKRRQHGFLETEEVGGW